MAQKKLAAVHTTMPFDEFWGWVQKHPNCILRAATPDAILYDDDDLHWHFGVEEDDTQVLQVYRGKKIMGELFIRPADVAYVQVEARDGEEFAFELISGSQSSQWSQYEFVLAHGFEDEDSEPETSSSSSSSPGGWKH